MKFTKTMKDAAIKKYKQQIFDDEYQKKYDKLEAIALANNTQVDQNEYDLKKKEVDKKFVGFGIKQSRAIKDKQEFGEKYTIDKKLLKKNILALKYLKKMRIMLQHSSLLKFPIRLNPLSRNTS